MYLNELFILDSLKGPKVKSPYIAKPLRGHRVPPGIPQWLLYCTYTNQFKLSYNTDFGSHIVLKRFSHENLYSACLPKKIQFIFYCGSYCYLILAINMLLFMYTCYYTHYYEIYCSSMHVIVHIYMLLWMLLSMYTCYYECYCYLSLGTCFLCS